MDWNNSCLHVYQFIVMMLSHPHSNLMLTFSILLLSLKCVNFQELWPSLGIVISLQNREQDFVYLRTSCLRSEVSCHTGNLVLHIT